MLAFGLCRDGTCEAHDRVSLTAHSALRDHPPLEIRPGLSVSPDWNRLGVRPKCAATVREDLNRRGSSTAALKVSAVAAPTPGTVIRRWQMGSLRTTALTCIHGKVICVKRRSYEFVASRRCRFWCIGGPLTREVFARLVAFHARAMAHSFLSDHLPMRR
jgi:hypothetical protein